MKEKGFYRRYRGEDDRPVNCFRCRAVIGHLDEYGGLTPLRGRPQGTVLASPEVLAALGITNEDFGADMFAVARCRTCGALHYFESRAPTYMLLLISRTPPAVGDPRDDTKLVLVVDGGRILYNHRDRPPTSAP